ncbi:MAG: DUF3054 domain-containing protein [Gaiellaceae bacterium]
MRADRQRRLLMLGDLSPIVVFAVIGGASHDGGFSLVEVLRNIGLFGAGWIVAALLLRPYSRATAARLASTWLLGISAGVFLRAAALGREINGEYLGFWGVTLAVTLVLLVAWRLVARTLTPRLA